MTGLAIVTGASSGIGRAIALQLARDGMNILAVARRADLLDALARDAEKEARDGAGKVYALGADLGDDADVLRVASRAEELGGATWLVNNAGTNVFGAFEARDLGPQLAMVRLHCHATVALVAAVLPQMRAKGPHAGATILNVASVAGFMATPYMAVYGASKAFVISFSEALREETKGTGIGVTVVCPGPVTTGIYDVGAPGAARTPPSHEMSPEACAKFAVDAARRGRVVAIPGARNRFDVYSAMLAPRAIVRAILRRRGLGYLGYTRDALKLPP